MNSFEKDSIEIVKAALFDTVPTVSDDYDFNKLFAYASEFGLTSLFYYGSTKIVRFANFPQKREILMGVCKDIAMNKVQTEVIESLAQAFKKHDIHFCFLKGYELKQLYRKPEMRPMADCDILISPHDYKKAMQVMKDENFVFFHKSNHDTSWIKDKKVLVELHNRLNDPFFEKECAILDNVEKYVCDDRLCPEFSFIYQIEHFSKHAFTGSALLKHMLDIYLYLNNHKNMDMSFVENELNKLKLSDFYRTVCRTLSVWFDGEISDESTDKLTDLIFISRAERKVRYKISEYINEDNSAKANTWLKRLFLPYRHMKLHYPTLEKYPILLPAFWIIRLAKFLFSSRGITQKMDTVRCTVDYNYNEYKDEMKTIGLYEKYKNI